MKRLIAAATLGSLLATPVTAFAYRGGHHHDGHNDAVAWGILGGIVAGVVLDRALLPPPVVVRGPAYYPSEPAYYPRPYGYTYTRPYRGAYYRVAPRPRCNGWRGYRY